MKELFDTELSQRLKMSPILSENKNVEERWFRSVQTAFHLSPSHFSTGPNDDFIDIAFVSSETSFYQFAVSWYNMVAWQPNKTIQMFFSMLWLFPTVYSIRFPVQNKINVWQIWKAGQHGLSGHSNGAGLRLLETSFIELFIFNNLRVNLIGDWRYHTLHAL